MDLINEKKIYPQRVEVVNDLKVNVENSVDNPLNVVLPSSFVSSSGNVTSIRVLDSQANQAVYIRPSSGNYVNGFVSAVHVLNNSFGYVFPINQNFYNISSASVFETTIIPSFYSSFEAKFPSASSIIVFYSYQNSQRAYTFAAYSGE